MTPAVSTDLVTLESVKQAMDIVGGASDATLTSAIKDVSAAFCARAAREFARETVIEAFRPEPSGAALVLTRRPVATITAVVEDGVALAAGEWERFGRLLYRLDGAGRRTSWRAVKVEVSYSGGYVLPAECPADLAGAARRMVKLRYYERLRDPGIKAQEIPGVLDEEYWVGAIPGHDLDGMPPDVASVLDHYRYR